MTAPCDPAICGTTGDLTLYVHAAVPNANRELYNCVQVLFDNMPEFAVTMLKSLSVVRLDTLKGAHGIEFMRNNGISAVPALQVRFPKYMVVYNITQIKDVLIKHTVYATPHIQSSLGSSFARATPISYLKDFYVKMFGERYEQCADPRTYAQRAQQETRKQPKGGKYESMKVGQVPQRRTLAMDKVYQVGARVRAVTTAKPMCVDPLAVVPKHFNRHR